MSDVTKQAVLDALKVLPAPEGSGDVVSRGMISEIVIANRKVYFAVTVPAEKAGSLEPLRKAAEAVVAKLEGVDSVSAVLTAERAASRPGSPGGPAPAQRPAGAPAAGQRPRSIEVPGVKHIIAVASGKGGVGKSTTAVNLALGFQALGLRTGLLDADIYGPSVPRLTGLSGKPQVLDNHSIKPMSAYGLKLMSMGFLVDEGTPVVWRGPMVVSALTQMLRDVAWDPLDVLVVDMPPGTGDVQLTMSQNIALSGCIIVSTPQDLALIDARKGLAMFKQVNVPVLGIIENMSYFACPKCGERSDIFGHGGARREAEALGVPFLGEVPLDMEIRQKSDLGTPIVASAPDSPYAKIYTEIARLAWAALDGGAPRKAAPKINIQ
jgi:ATP-binding protein involved in chromosome partitioning